MAFIDTTFFGEVSDLRSRAVWSDSEEDDGDEVVNPLEQDLTVTGVMPSTNFSIVYITSHKISKPGKEASMTISINGKAFARFTAIDSENGWLALDVSRFVNKDYELVNTLKKVLEYFFKNAQVSHSSIISNEYSYASENIEYLSSVNSQTLPFPKSLLKHQIRAPKMITNIVDASLFNYFITNSQACTLFQLPDQRSVNFNISQTSLPKALIDSFGAVNHLSAESNLYA